ncbi:MAG: helix-turn-helix domain-containing protein [Patescibacteria group bacterium]
MLKTALQKIGLTQKDSEVYLACLELGTQPASVIAKKAGLKRPTTYLILECLLKKGLVSEYTGSNVKYFTAVQPEYLLTYLEKKRRELTSHQREMEELIPQFAALSNPYSLSPRVRFFEGAEGLERVMDDTLNSKSPILCYSCTDSWFSREDTKHYIMSYGKRRVFEKMIPIRAIYVDTPLSRQYHDKEYPTDDGKPELTEFRWMDSSVKQLNNEINIYDDKVAIVTLGKYELMGVIIESKEIANSHRAIFEMAWKSATK